MTYYKNILLGSGMSSIVYFNLKMKIKVITGDEKNFKSKNFYEYQAFGGNSNIWGGYINFDRHKKFLKNKNYNKLFKKIISKKKYLVKILFTILIVSLIKIKIF